MLGAPLKASSVTCTVQAHPRMRPVSGSLQGLFGTGQGGLTMSRTTKNHRRAKLRVLFQETRLRSGPNPSIRSRRHPGPARATPPCPCGLAVRPDVEPVGRLSRAGGATPRPGPPGRSTAGRCHPPAPQRYLQLQPRRRREPQTAHSWRSLSTSAAARSRARRCPFPRGGRSTSARSRRPTLPLRIGMKFGAVGTAEGRALFRLQVPRADLPGRWVCLTQRFVLVKTSRAGGAGASLAKRGRGAVSSGANSTVTVL